MASLLFELLKQKKKKKKRNQSRGEPIKTRTKIIHLHVDDVKCGKTCDSDSQLVGSFTSDWMRK